MQKELGLSVIDKNCTWGSRGKRIVLGVIVIVGLGLAVPLSWLAVDWSLHNTADQAFCGSCHSMKPMQASFLEDVHGGNSLVGVQALCTDCHLPQDNSVSYLYVKAKNGTWDLLKEHVIGAEDVDWRGKRLVANRYVYDSGCLKCHNNLQSGSELSNKQFVAHKPYFQKNISKTCIDCHQVGHKNLEMHLERHESNSKEVSDS